MIFKKRKLVTMLLELRSALKRTDQRELAKRLDSSDPNTTIAAMWELAILWALNRELAASPYLSAEQVTSKPDISFHVGLGRAIAVEVKSLSGDTFEFADHLRTATSAIKSYFDKIVPDANYTYDITYHEWRDSKAYIRRRPAVCKDPTTSTAFKEQFYHFVSSGDDSRQLHIPRIIHATFHRKAYKSKTFTYHSNVQPLIQTVKNNQGDKVVCNARRQLLPFKNSHFLGLILCDGGNNAIADYMQLRDWATPDSREMMHLILKDSGIDFLFTIGRRDEFSGNAISFTAYSTYPTLALNFYPSDDLNDIEGVTIRDSIIRALRHIPVPAIFPRQAKERLRWQQQSGQRIQHRYLNGCISGSGDSMTLKISANALVQFLSGEIPVDEFNKHLQPFRDVFPLSSLKGMKIKSISLEDKGDSEDDDYATFEFERDWSGETFLNIDRMASSKKDR